MRYNSETVDGFVDAVDPEHREAVVGLRDQARRVLVGYCESMRFGMPTYEKDDRVYAFTRQKHYFSLYGMMLGWLRRINLGLDRDVIWEELHQVSKAEDIPWGVLDELLRAAYL